MIALIYPLVVVIFFKILILFSMSAEEGTIDLRNGSDEPEFQINNVEPEEVAESILGKIEAAPVGELGELAQRSSDKVKVKFDKFVNLIATHAYEDVLEKHVDDDVIISTDLLTDLANAHEEKQDRKMPMIFLVGIILGIILTYVLLKT